jgi:hypothetical protein
MCIQRDDAPVSMSDAGMAVLETVGQQEKALRRAEWSC